MKLFHRGPGQCDFAVKVLEKSLFNESSKCGPFLILLTFGLLTLGTDGTHGAGQQTLVNSIRLYRRIPLRRLWHPEPGSSAQGLAAARAGLGVAGVAAAIRNCGCMTKGTTE